MERITTEIRGDEMRAEKEKGLSTHRFIWSGGVTVLFWGEYWKFLELMNRGRSQ